MSTVTPEQTKKTGESKIDDDFLSKFLAKLKGISESTAKMVKETSDEASHDFGRVGDKTAATNKGVVDKFVKDLKLTPEEREKAEKEAREKAESKQKKLDEVLKKLEQDKKMVAVRVRECSPKNIEEVRKSALGLQNSAKLLDKELLNFRIDFPAHIDLILELESRADTLSKDVRAVNKEVNEIDFDSHGNIRTLAQREDSLVNDKIESIKKLPNAIAFQKQNFSKRMTHVLGNNDLNWDSLIGTGEESNPFDVISQMGVFGKDNEGKVLNEAKLSYVAVQDSLYDDEPGSRHKMVNALYPKKLEKLQNDTVNVVASRKNAIELTQAWTAMNDLFKPFEEWETKFKSSKDEKEKKNFAEEMNKAKTPWMKAVNLAFKRMGMQGVSEGVSDTRKRIKDGIFLGKKHETTGRGRNEAKRTLAEMLIGFIPKAIEKLKTTDEPKAKQLTDEGNKLKELIKKLEKVQEERLGYSDPKNPQEMPEKFNNEEIKALDLVNDQAKVVQALMKDLNIGVDDKSGWEKGLGIGSDDTSEPRDVYATKNPIFMGKNQNTRDVDSNASAIFAELGIPFTGGASGSTVDAVGGIVDSLKPEKTGEDDGDFKLSEENLEKAETETCMYILGMNTHGHHSLVEMIYAAKQYPQGLFSNLRDPISDYNECMENRKKFLEQPFGPLTEFEEQVKKETEGKQLTKEEEERIDLGRGKVKALQFQAMMEKYPGISGKDIISHEQCIKEFMDRCDKLVKNVKV